MDMLPARSPKHSSRTMAMEYASSPVEQPGTQTRIGSLAILFSMILGKNRSASAWNASGSRKKPVT